MNIKNLLADALESAAARIRANSCGMTNEEMEIALHKMLYMLNGDRHFTEDTARPVIAKMYYFASETEKCYAPFFDYKVLRKAYEKIKNTIPDDYGFWDFAVTANLMYSNHIDTLRGWFKRKDVLLDKTCDLARSFLLDEDTDHPTDKIWWYINS